MNDEAILITFVIVGALITYMIFFMSRIMRQESRPSETGEGAIECGCEAVGEARGIGFRYFNFAILFLVFEIAALFTFLFAVNKVRNISMLFSLGVFIITLIITIFWATKKEDLYAT
jgi:NADH:ubiquinone oxidoreductase subunit 3 (subunit A)